MAEQATDAVENRDSAGTVAHATAEVSHHGKPLSWIAVTVVIIGFLVGGFAFVPQPHWWVFWLGAGIAVVGCIMTLFAHTFSDDWY